MRIDCLEHPGSLVTLITSKIAKSLTLKLEKSNMILSGIGNEELRARISASLQIFTSFGTSFFTSAYIVNKISHHVTYRDVTSLKDAANTWNMLKFS